MEPTPAHTQEFFADRAHGWEERFPDDAPKYAAAVAELALPAGGVALDAGCGTGRVLEPLRAAVGPGGTVLGVDLTPEMLAEARRRGRERFAALVLGDVARLPLPGGVVDAVMAAGLLPHTGDPAAVLRELARVARPGARLAVFHPVGRGPLAERHGRALSDDEVVAPARLAPLLGATGWEPLRFDDGPDRYLALAARRAATPDQEEPR
jgi:SAM-dependent methyltransferase